MTGAGHFAKLKVGIIVSHLAGERFASGIVSSAKYILDSNRGVLRDAKIEVELVEKNDGGDSGKALEVFAECVEQGCVAVIGPSSSRSMYAVLSRREFDAVPKLATFATSSSVSDRPRDDFFRVTMSDRDRVTRLIERSQQGATGSRRIVVFSLEDVPASYADSLRRDALAVLRERKILSRDILFRSGDDPAIVPRPSDAVLFCAPSRQAVEMMRKLRDRGCRSPFFAFGSNLNFRAREAVGTVVVVDSDRNSDDPVIARHLAEFRAKFPQEEEPSTPTMVGASILVSALLGIAPEDRQEVDKARLALKRQFNEKTLVGINGKVWFDEGELVGRESVPLLRIVERKGSVDFERDRVEAPVRIAARNMVIEGTKRYGHAVYYLLGLLAAIVTLRVYIGI